VIDSRPHSFKLFALPAGDKVWIPEDLELRVPESASLDPALLHRLIYIPWSNAYLSRVPAAYRAFFEFVLPHLHVRTTDVHVATCLPFAAELIQDDPAGVDEVVVHLAFILHDAGWSEMSEQEIADSLGVAGLALSGAAVNPKERHVELGAALAERLLAEAPLRPPPTEAQRALIRQAILYHDKPQQLAAMGELSPSVRTVCDVDHLWSFTHENFWQDTVRKGVGPPEYVSNLGADLDGYFVGEAGRRKARRMLDERRSEVDAWRRWVEARPAVGS
jgi:hypothetical protein